MDEATPRGIRGRIAKTLPRRQRDYHGPIRRACPSCGTPLSRYNDGPYCHPCDIVEGEPVFPAIRGRTIDD